MSTTHETPEATAEGEKPCIAVVFGGRSSEYSHLAHHRPVRAARIDRDRWDVVGAWDLPDGAWFLAFLGGARGAAGRAAHGAAARGPPPREPPAGGTAGC
ncbi:hypothetical protein QJS66_00790 [Kocuria rhizophila]|nr:hypothetical protein QJS66_00790 [Kocuria rhizophila]